MDVTGTLGADWLGKHGALGHVADERLRAWRDYLELRLGQELKLDADFAIGEETRFFLASDAHTIIEIEAFTRRALDEFLDKEARNPTSMIS